MIRYLEFLKCQKRLWKKARERWQRMLSRDRIGRVFPRKREREFFQKVLKASCGQDAIHSRAILSQLMRRSRKTLSTNTTFHIAEPPGCSNQKTFFSPFNTFRTEKGSVVFSHPASFIRIKVTCLFQLLARSFLKSLSELFFQVLDLFPLEKYPCS